MGAMMRETSFSGLQSGHGFRAISTRLPFFFRLGLLYYSQKVGSKVPVFLRGYRGTSSSNLYGTEPLPKLLAKIEASIKLPPRSTKLHTN